MQEALARVRGQIERAPSSVRYDPITGRILTWVEAECAAGLAYQLGKPPGAPIALPPADHRPA
jgi:hypothetical protein